MKTAFELFDELTEADADWIFSRGLERRIPPNGTIIREGERPDAVYVVLDGLFAVSVAAVGDGPLVTRGPGEMVGKLAFLEDRPASASVTAVEESRVLALTRSTLDARFAEDVAFAARFYRAIALVATRLLRRRERTQERSWRDKVRDEHIAIRAWEPVGRVMARFKQLLGRVERDALKNANQIPPGTVDEVLGAFREVTDFANSILGGDHPELSGSVEELGLRLQQEFLPYLLLTRAAERLYSKPRGYAGDYLSIEMIYRNEPAGTGRLGPLIDKCFLDSPAAVAVRNRRGVMADEITRVVAESRTEPARVTSMACGPARELFDVFRLLTDPARLSASLIDIDLQALAFVAENRDRAKLQRQMKLINGNLVYLALGRERIDLRDQDLVYSIGLIDYFSDRIVIKLLDYIHGLLRPGGKVILGNFHPRNPSKALMDYVLDWKLTHRAEEDMHRLFGQRHFLN